MRVERDATTLRVQIDRPAATPPFVKFTSISSTAANGSPSNPGKASANPGQDITLTGRGFTGNSGVTTHLQGPDGLEWQAKRYATSPEGTFEREISSGEFVPGTYAVWAMDDRTRITSAKATFEVVTAARPSTP